MAHINYKRQTPPHRHLPHNTAAGASTNDHTRAIMAVELPTLLLQFQPEAEELKSHQKYDQAARQFVKQLDNVSASHWLKGADTPQDVLEVGGAPSCADDADRKRFSTLHSTR